MSPPPAQPQMSSGQFQPASSFGQQLVGHVNGAYGGTPQQQQQQPQYSGYPASPQYSQGYQQGYPSQQPQQQQYMAEFDPYSQNQGAQAGTPLGAGGQYSGAGQPQQRQHPREFVQSHKSELEVWDPYTWKQVRSTRFA